MTKQNKIVTVKVTFKNTDATDALKNYAQDKVSHCIQKFVHQDTEVHVVLNVNKRRQAAEVSLNTDGASFIAKEDTEDMYKSIDAIVDSLTSQLRKHKEKITSHH